MNTAVQFTEAQRDCLQETINIAMGQAGDSLARLLNVFIYLSVPTVSLIAPGQMIGALSGLLKHDSAVSAVRQGYYGATDPQGLRGESIVVFSDASYHELANLLAYDSQLDLHAQQELLLDVSNILNGACLGSLANQLGQQLSYAPPALIGQGIPIQNVVDPQQLNWHQVLVVNINYKLENNRFQCDMLLLMPDPTVRVLLQSLDRILDQLE
ncbi:MAG: histidine kinase [Pseudomonadota bacterium]|nr:histidine kinase [Pseudomonadota bacterium]